MTLGAPWVALGQLRESPGAAWGLTSGSLGALGGSWGVPWGVPGGSLGSPRGPPGAPGTLDRLPRVAEGSPVEPGTGAEGPWGDKGG